MPKPSPRPISSSLPRLGARIALLVGFALLAGCQSGPKSKLNKEEQLDLYRLTARGHYDNNDLNTAESQALKGLELDDKDPALRLMLGWILVRRGDLASLERAEWVFDEYIDDNGGESRAWLGLAAALERLGAAYEVVGDEIASGERLPDRSTPAKRSAHFKKLARRAWTDAASHYGRTLNEDSGSLRALDGQLRVAARLGDYGLALEWSNKLLDLAAGELAWFQRALRERQLDGREEARMRLSESIVRELMFNTNLMASSIHVSRNELSEALTNLNDALDLDPSYVAGYSRRAQVRYELGEYVGAKSDITKFIARSDLPIRNPEMQVAFALRDYSEREDPTLDLDSSMQAMLDASKIAPTTLSNFEG